MGRGRRGQGNNGSYSGSGNGSNSGSYSGSGSDSGNGSGNGYGGNGGSYRGNLPVTGGESLLPVALGLGLSGIGFIVRRRRTAK